MLAPNDNFCAFVNLAQKAQSALQRGYGGNIHRFHSPGEREARTVLQLLRKPNLRAIFFTELFKRH